MFYVKIPVKTEKEGIRVAEDHLGSMYWRTMPDGSVEAYPYESNPISVVAIKPPNNTVEDRCAKCGGFKSESPLFNGLKCHECGAEYPRTT